MKFFENMFNSIRYLLISIITPPKAGNKENTTTEKEYTNIITDNDNQLNKSLLEEDVINTKPN
jgi:hypothetical protein